MKSWSYLCLRKISLDCRSCLENPGRRLCSVNSRAYGGSHWVSDRKQLDSRDALDLLMDWVEGMRDREKAGMTSRQFGRCHLPR